MSPYIPKPDYIPEYDVHARSYAHREYRYVPDSKPSVNELGNKWTLQNISHYFPSITFSVKCFNKYSDAKHQASEIINTWYAVLHNSHNFQLPFELQ